MTTFEHAMLGVNGALATGLHQKFGWKIVAIAGISAASPDWDGLPIVYSVELFNRAHRVWGHNILSCVVLGVVIGILDYRFDLVTRAARLIDRCVRFGISEANLALREQFSNYGTLVWCAVAILACLSQLPADMVVSGTATLADWELQPFWPFSDQGVVFPMVPWGDPGMTIVFVLGMFAMLRWKSSFRTIACLTLAGVVAYILARGLMGQATH